MVSTVKILLHTRQERQTNQTHKVHSLIDECTGYLTYGNVELQGFSFAFFWFLSPSVLKCCRTCKCNLNLSKSVINKNSTSLQNDRQAWKLGKLLSTEQPGNVLILIRIFYIFVQIFTVIFKIFVILNGEEQTKAKTPLNQTKIWGLCSEKDITKIMSFSLILP